LPINEKLEFKHIFPYLNRKNAIQAIYEFKLP